MTEEQLVEIVKAAVSNGQVGMSNLDPETASIGGFSTITMRHVWNCIGSGVGTYLEIGAFRGATCCAAACNNKNLNSYIIENFSQDFSQKGVRDDLLKNIENARRKTGGMTLIEGDCWTVDKSSLPKIDCYFYDGRHDAQDQAKALPEMLEFLADNFIFIVDDANWSTVREGSDEGFRRVKDRIQIVKHWEFRPAGDNDPIWHNGVTIHVCSKI